MGLLVLNFKIYYRVTGFETAQWVGNEGHMAGMVNFFLASVSKVLQKGHGMFIGIIFKK